MQLNRNNFIIVENPDWLFDNVHSTKLALCEEHKVKVLIKKLSISLKIFIFLCCFEPKKTVSFSPVNIWASLYWRRCLQRTATPANENKNTKRPLVKSVAGRCEGKRRRGLMFPVISLPMLRGLIWHRVSSFLSSLQPFSVFLMPSYM